MSNEQIRIWLFTYSYSKGLSMEEITALWKENREQIFCSNLFRFSRLSEVNYENFSYHIHVYKLVVVLADPIFWMSFLKQKIFLVGCKPK